MSTTKSGGTAKSMVQMFLVAHLAERSGQRIMRKLCRSPSKTSIDRNLPAVFYMFPFGYRPGKENFLNFRGYAATSRERKSTATVDHITSVPAETEDFEGFKKTTQAILGDLLLCFCLENTKRALGRQEQVQRFAPAHYMASWVDLSKSVGSFVSYLR